MKLLIKFTIIVLIQKRKNRLKYEARKFIQEHFIN